MRRSLSRGITYANVMATLAIFIALGSTATAAVVKLRANSVTGTHVKDNSLTGADVRNGSLTSSDLSAAARSSFTGPKGSTGATGARGLTGATGPKGDTGAPGAPAEVVTSFATRDTGFVVRNNLTPPNPSGLDGGTTTAPEPTTTSGRVAARTATSRTRASATCRSRRRGPPWWR
jgi:hypothetical protein